MDQSWVRKKFAPHHAPTSGYHLQDWHQDGALGVRFPREPGPAIPMTDLLTCWIPLQECGIDSPGLEFICRRQPALLHFTELHDSALRRRFPPHEFWAPKLEFGDGLVFLNDVLHRTCVRPRDATRPVERGIPHLPSFAVDSQCGGTTGDTRVISR